MSRRDSNRKVLLVGVGGQGLLTAARILGQAARDEGCGVLMGQLHGLSQRGGSVETSVLIGDHRGAFIGRGEADVVLGFEPLETQRALSSMSDQTSVVLNTKPIVPFGMTHSGETYPSLDLILDKIRSVATRVTTVEGTAAAHEAGNSRTLNVVMLGTLSQLDVLPFSGEALLTALERHSPPAYLEVNRKAFDLGRKLAEASAAAATQG